MSKIKRFRANRWIRINSFYYLLLIGSFVPMIMPSIRRVKHARIGMMWIAKLRLSTTPATTLIYIESVPVWNLCTTTTCVAMPSLRIIFNAAKPATWFDSPRIRWIEYLRPTTTIAKYCEVAVAISITKTTRKTNTISRNRTRRIKIPRRRAASERPVESNRTPA